MSKFSTCNKIAPVHLLRWLLFIVIVIGLPQVGFPQTFSWDVSVPFALAPVGQIGAALSPEFDRRILDGQLVYQRRAALRMGWTPTSQWAFWCEGGVASLQLYEGSKILQGAYGPAVGGGWSFLWSEPLWKGWTPFSSGRATYLQSKLSDDAYQGSNLQSRRSRFEWIEYSGILGAARHFNGGDLQTGLAIRILEQDEYRTFRNGSIVRKAHSTFSTGVQAGLALGGKITLDHRLTMWVMAETSLNYQKLTVSIGQWGSP